MGRLRLHPLLAASLGLALLGPSPLASLAAAPAASPSRVSEPAGGGANPTAVSSVVVAAAPDRFLAWPANNGFWSWQGGREMLVGFSDGPWRPEAEGHKVGQPQEFRLARSLDGGLTWSVEVPPQDVSRIGKPLPPGPGEIRFDHPDLAVRVVAGAGKGGPGRIGAFHVSTDRGRTWRGPWAFSGLEDDPALAGLRITSRTSVLPLGRDSAVFLLSAQDPSLGRWAGRLDKPFAVRSDDGGRSFRFLGWLVPRSDPYRAVMPSAVDLGGGRFVAALRRRNPRGGENENWIDLVVSEDGGRRWQFRSRVGEAGCCNGNPPALIRLRDGRLACTWADRRRQVMLLRLSADEGRTWGPERVVRSNPHASDMGYPQIGQNDRGELVILYYLATAERPASFIEASLLEASLVRP
ncbi:glycoside hydrolase [Cyanobium sp. FGCU-52]|nr:glycoside hydrolase [Cyanobium sp. FGCU52]